MLLSDACVFVYVVCLCVVSVFNATREKRKKSSSKQKEEESSKSHRLTSTHCGLRTPNLALESKKIVLKP